jgi:restriction system protein
MSRRNEGLLEDLVEIAAKLPWWAGVALAVVSYFGFHHFAVMEIASSSDIKQIGSIVGKNLFKSAALVLQYLFPAAFLIGAIVSLVRGRKRGKLYAGVAASDARSALEAMSWLEFEQLVGEYFRRQGFQVTEQGGRSADGGVDLVATIGSDRYLVQCKQWKARQVGVAPVRELYGVMAAEHAAGGFLITSGTFTAEAQRFAAGKEIELMNGDKLLELIRERKAAAPSAPAPAAAPAPLATDACPACGSKMLLRVARKGAGAGNSFWGCSTFPKCRATRAV